MTDFLAPPIIDIEASGFGAASYPIEVGVILPDGESYCSLIAPASGWLHWDDGAEKIHGLNRETLLGYGRSAQEVAREVNSLLRGMTVYCDSWYHDFTWLSRLFDAGGSTQAFRLEDIRSLLDQTQMDAWHNTRLRVMEELQLDRHRASNDAKVLQQTLQRVKCPAPSA